ncbi:hypothetical protein LQZ21_06730 [Treponema sp. TIM-1]|uniref:hypothetical protein n=1 Tax=Treponema sp. TIM-1 TaxID=2898417 RepID=UPI00397F510B
MTVNQNSAPTPEELSQKIALNKTLHDELQYQIRQLKWSQLTVFKLNFTYIPTHYIAKYSPLRFIDVPKIRTITKFGDKVVLENSKYIHTVSGVRIWAYEKLVALLDLRLR